MLSSTIVQSSGLVPPWVSIDPHECLLDGCWVLSESSRSMGSKPLAPNMVMPAQTKLLFPLGRIISPDLVTFLELSEFQVRVVVLVATCPRAPYTTSLAPIMDCLVSPIQPMPLGIPVVSELMGSLPSNQEDM